MNRFWDIIIKPCLEAINSKNIVEIGSDYGIGTKNLIKYCQDVQGEITSIDPFPKYDYKEWEKEYNDIFKLYTDLSLNRLPLLKGYDSILIDGDHNWYTVYNELKIIQGISLNNELPLIFLHDIDWPYARRDLYYNPDNIPVAYRQAYTKKGIMPNELNLVDEGGLNDHLNNAIYQNNLRNGVRTAIEDFMNEFPNKDRIAFLSVPGFFGLGIIYDKKKHESILKVINDEVVNINVAHKIELERISLLIKNKDLNRQNQKLVKEKNALLGQDKKLIEEKEALLEQNKGLVEESEVLLEQNKGLMEEKETLLQQNKEIIGENKELVEQNKILTEKNKELAKKYDLEKSNHMQSVKNLKVNLEKRDKTIEKLNKDISIHLNSIRYRVGDTLVRGSHFSVDTLKIPVRLVKLFKEGNKKKDDPVKQKTFNDTVHAASNNKSTSDNKMISNIVVENNQTKYESKLRGFNYSNFEYQLKKIIKERVNIIIPIYNAVDEVSECINSVIENTTLPYKLILIDDCSTDVRIRELLSQYESKDDIEVIYNTENLGYVKTINRAIQGTVQGDIVLLNSDTKVSEKWLTKMVIAAIQHKRVGTVTPFSNAAGAFSVPVMGENSEIPDYLNLKDMNRIVEENSKFAYVEVPTGNGFCMYIKRDLINDIGLFDDVIFTRGYGEENDFCMRALEKGWKNIIDDSTYIYHKRSASFSNSKQQLIKGNREKLDSMYPDYKIKIKIFKESEELIKIRKKIEKSMNEFLVNNKLYTLNKNILYVLHEAGGGTPNTNKDLMSVISHSNYTTYVLISNGKTLKLGLYKENEINEIERWNLNKAWNVDTFSSEEYRNIYFDILYNLKIDVLHVRHLIKHSFDIIDVANILNIPIIMSFHDFYYICPSIHMLDKKGKYCEANCCRDKQDCYMSPQIKIEGNVSNWVQDVWKPKVKEMLGKCDAFVTTSKYSWDLHIKAYPMLEKSKFYVIEHGRDFEYEPLNPLEFYSRNDKIRILLPGNIGFNKGSKFISKLIEYDKNGKMEFHVLGKYDKNLKGNFINHGPYERNEFIEKIKMIKPNFIGIISIWPETYCHTLTEAWSCGIPSIVSDIGTLRERAIDGGSILIDHTNVEETYNKIMEAYEIEKYKTLCKETLERKIRSIKSMSVEYIKLYKMIKSEQEVNLIYFFYEENANSFKSPNDLKAMSNIVDNPILNENSYIYINPNIDEISINMDVEANIFMYVRKNFSNNKQLDNIIKIKETFPQLKLITEINEEIFNKNELNDKDSEQLSKVELLKKLYLLSDKVILTDVKILEKIKKFNDKKEAIIKDSISNFNLYEWKEVFTNNENSI